VVGDGRETGRVKLIAELLGVGLDQLAQRDKQRQRMLLSGAVLAACVFAVVAALAIWQSIVAIRNERTANENVARVFVERAKRTLVSGDIALSAKYTLAGVTIAPSAREEQQPILADTLHRGGPISGALTLQVPIGGLGLSFHGDSVALVDERGMVGLQSRDGRREWIRSAHDLAGSHLTVSDDGEFVASSGYDGTVQIFDLKTGTPKGEPLVQEVATAFTVFSASGRELLVAGVPDRNSPDTPVSFYKVGSAAPVWATRMAGDVVAARIIPDGREIVLIDGEGTALRLDSANGNVVGSRRVLTLGERSRVIIDKPGRVAFVGSNGVLTAISLDDGKVLFRREPTPSGPITAIAVGTTILAFGDVFGRIFILSLHDGRLLANGYGHGADVSRIYISGDEKVIASATDHFIRFWRPGWATFRAQYDGDARLALSRDQTRLAVATASHVQVLPLTDVGQTSRYHSRQRSPLNGLWR
jgi:PQQ-like domain/WD domain, G-beta repeat